VVPVEEAGRVECVDTHTHMAHMAHMAHNLSLSLSLSLSMDTTMVIHPPVMDTIKTYLAL
jgi:hypothetical protein